MPTPSRFTEPVKAKILEYLSLGASRKTASLASGISPPTLTRWLQEGEHAAGGSAKRKFYEAACEAEAQGSIKALRIVSTEMENNPKLARWYLERREPGYAPPMPHAPSAPQGVTVIQLGLSDGTRQALPAPVIEGEVVDEPDSKGRTA